MSDFKPVENFQNQKLKHKYSKKILEALTNISKNYIYQKKDARKPNSNQIKYNFIKLGHELGYKVYANGLDEYQKAEFFESNKFVNREFLFDIHWYKDIEQEFYIPETVSLVVESELGDRRKGDVSKLRNPAVMFDFQKLLMANAELRLLIFKVKNTSELIVLNEYFEKAISSFKLLPKKSIFLFGCFNHENNRLYFCEKIKL